MDFAKFVAEKEARQRFLGNIGPADRLKAALDHLKPCLSGKPGVEEGLLV
jgi:hypothetical protein